MSIEGKSFRRIVKAQSHKPQPQIPGIKIPKPRKARSENRKKEPELPEDSPFIKAPEGDYCKDCLDGFYS